MMDRCMVDRIVMWRGVMMMMMVRWDRPRRLCDACM